MGRMSVATIKEPEFINVKPYNPLISQCEIKVLYVGENRNRTFIDKESAREMANSLPGCPIVGYYREDAKDFGDHGDFITIDVDGVHFNCITKPYGFIAPNAKIWFQEFEDTDEFGNVVIREYLMTNGYLWTGQYEEAKRVVNKGNGQSMELDKDFIQGKWSKNINTDIEFFIINDAIFSKLCILGEDIEPCFEGSSITDLNVSKNFAKDTVSDNFSKTLYSMMQDLKFALEGRTEMDNEKILVDSSTEISNEVQDKTNENFSLENQEITEESSIVETSTVDFSASENKEDEDGDKEDKEDKEDKSDSDDKDEDKEDYTLNDNKEEEKEEDESAKKYSLLEEKYNTLTQEYEELSTKYQALVEFKEQIDNEKKNALINSFYMLSDEDKKDVIANKANYSLDDIEAKLSVICVRNKVNFNLEDTSEQNNIEQPITTFSLDTNESSSVPAWISALRHTQSDRNN